MERRKLTQWFRSYVQPNLSAKSVHAQPTEALCRWYVPNVPTGKGRVAFERKCGREWLCNIDLAWGGDRLDACSAAHVSAKKSEAIENRIVAFKYRSEVTAKA